MESLRGQHGKLALCLCGKGMELDNRQDYNFPSLETGWSEPSSAEVWCQGGSREHRQVPQCVHLSLTREAGCINYFFYCYEKKMPNRRNLRKENLVWGSRFKREYGTPWLQACWQEGETSSEEAGTQPLPLHSLQDTPVSYMVLFSSADLQNVVVHFIQRDPFKNCGQ